jgi:hypothetical protein
MPSFKDVIREEDLLKIIEYIKSIGPKPSVGTEGSLPASIGSPQR